MKPVILWVDTLTTPSGIDARPSRLFALVKAVRTEALDAVELFVRKQKADPGSDAGSLASANQADILRLIAHLRDL